MQNEINTTLIIDAVKQIGKQFLDSYKKKEIPTTKEAFLVQLEEIETTCFNFLKPLINQHYPDIPWVADDEFDPDAQLQPADYGQYWLCDTMDGAVQYIQHLPGWTINLVLIRNGQPYFAVVYDPVADEVFSAKQTEGAYLNGSRIKAGLKADTDVMVAVFEYGHQAKKTANFEQKIAGSVAHLIKNFGVVRNYGPHALQLAYVGAGRIDLFLQEDLDTHNWLAGILIAQEAGAEVLTSDGQPWIWGTDNLLVAGKEIAALYLTSLT
ncbi:myo-inositol-1(or 4)-monophosphatase [Chitinophaga sp. YR627]|uniref:inositol monophosphatase family protein n=1 Tax=Chitinophaga sp. YR627 TaxID=1881041 RepID=UPI0008EBB94E|nr:inositol monophosphatase family protein [Chitinophaga sp. YR627]SFM99439.1 myo-inositol-1(or 4)-monophosphatase [Chitinophaga sp. YR627]